MGGIPGPIGFIVLSSRIVGSSVGLRKYAWPISSSQAPCLRSDTDLLPFECQAIPAIPVARDTLPADAALYSLGGLDEAFGGGAVPGPRPVR